MSTHVDGAVRRLAAVWFADIVGYTRLSSQDENAALRLVTILQESAAQELPAHSGRLVKLIGDAVLAEFSSSDAAVRSALALQERFAAAAAAAGINGKLRIGVHVGDVVSTPDGDLYGDGINTASRIQGQAQPGQVVVSQDVWHQLRQRRDFRCALVGERELKGLAGKVYIFSVRLADAAEAEAPLSPSPLPRREPARYARLVRVALAYVVVSAAALPLTELARERLALPEWVTPVAVLLLLIGFVVMLATGWVQSRPAWERRVGEQPPDPWRLDVEDLASSVKRRRLPELTWTRALLGGAAAFMVLFGTAGGYVLLRERELPLFGPRQAYAMPGPGLAILPFRASGAEAALWSEGMVDLLAIKLDGAAGVRVIDPRSVLSRWREREHVADSATAVRLAGQVAARYVLAGEVLAGPERLTISARVYDAETGAVLGTPSVEGSPDSLAQLIDRFGLQVLRTGIAPVSGSQHEPLDLDQLATGSITALRAYLVGAQEFRRSRWTEAQNAFRRAIDADSTFALAMYRMALTTSWSEQPHVLRADGFSAAANRFANRLSERDALLVQGYQQLNQRAASAIETLRSLTERYPDDVEGWFLLGDAYYHLGSGDARFRDALRTALRLDPTFSPAYLHLIEDAVERDESADARQLIARYREVDPGSPLLSSLVLLLDRERPAPVQQQQQPSAGPSATAEPARTAYEGARQAADAARSGAAAAGVTPNQPALVRADSLRRSAIADASAGRYLSAQRLMDNARVGYDEARATAVWKARLDSALVALEPLRAAARLSAADADEIESTLRLAAAAERDGRYEEALRQLRAAGDRYRRAAAAAAAAPTPPPAQPVRPPEPEARPGERPEAVASGVLDELRRALENKDIDALRSVWVTLTPAETRNFEASFALMRNLKVSFDVLAAESAGDNIEITTRPAYDFVNASSGRSDRQVFTQRLQFAQRNGRWVIVASR